MDEEADESSADDADTAEDDEGTEEAGPGEYSTEGADCDVEGDSAEVSALEATSLANQELAAEMDDSSDVTEPIALSEGGAADEDDEPP